MRSKIETLELPRPGRRPRVDGTVTATVVGGGLAGLAAATVLAERGVRVTVLEKESFLGGRAGAWTDRLADGGTFEMERGFHAFFRQYYNLRALLRRIDPTLSMLVPLEDYPILGPDGRTESFAGLPLRAPWNVIALTRRTPTMGWRDLMKVNGLAALEMLRYDAARCYARFDGISARAYLDSLRFPPDARRMLFDVFSHSFFNPEEDMSAGELLMMFHFYFVGNPEGLIFDVVNRPFSTAIFEPLARYLEARGTTIRRGASVARARPQPGGGFVVEVEGEAERVTTDLLVLATTVSGLRRLVGDSPELGDAAWRARVEGLALTRPFAVWRLWLDRPLDAGRAPFAGTTGVGLLDNISLYHLLEDESAAWAARTGGSVVELHAYGVPPDIPEADLRADLLDGLHRFYPETRDARTLEERWLWRQDCPAFATGSDAGRPGVRTPDRCLALAGDFVKLPMPSALMERAVTSGMLAANCVLAGFDVQPEPLQSIPRRGMLAGWRRAGPGPAERELVS
jgi:isorenieratene synthase